MKNRDIIIYGESDHNVNSNNETLNEDNLLFAKRTMIFNALRNHTDIVSEEEYFPEDDIKKIHLTIDVVIVDRIRYDRLLEAEDRWKKSKDYTDKPNLIA